MRWGILFGTLVIVAGCAGKSNSDDDDSGGSRNDAGTGGSGATGGSLGNGLGGTSTAHAGTAGVVDQNCTDVSTDAPAVDIDHAGDVAPPTPQGGTIASGTYYLDSELVYGQTAECVDIKASYNALGIMLTEVIRFETTSANAGTIEIAVESAAQGSATHVTGAGTYTTSGTLISVTPTCGNTAGSSGTADEAPYTATADGFILFDDGSSTCSPVVAIFRRL